jgi:hypothetical protein
MTGQTQVETAFIAEYNRRIGATNAILSSYAEDMAAWMQDSAIWTDRTAAARNHLYGLVEWKTDMINLVIGGSMDYQRFLELANGGKYAIVRPCLLRFAPDILRDLKRIWQ